MVILMSSFSFLLLITSPPFAIRTVPERVQAQFPILSHIYLKAVKKSCLFFLNRISVFVSEFACNDLYQINKYTDSKNAGGEKIKNA